MDFLLDYVFTPHPTSGFIWIFGMVFFLNFFICRDLSIKLVKAGYIKKYIYIAPKLDINPEYRKQMMNPEYKKLFILWFFPIVGVFGLIALYIICVVAKFLAVAKQKLFLNHI